MGENATITEAEKVLRYNFWNGAYHYEPRFDLVGYDFFPSFMLSNLFKRNNKTMAFKQFMKPTFNPPVRFFATLPTSKQLAAQTQAQKLFNQGIENWNKDDLDGASMAFSESIESFPTSDAHFNLANVYHSQGIHDLAIDHWKKSLEMEERVDAHVNIANATALFLQKPNDALEHYVKALELSPSGQDPEINYSYGVVLDYCGKVEEAIEQYTVAVSLGLDHAENKLRNAKARLFARTLEKDSNE
jgi:tetratricopeptide (TPR) repeat protein